MPRAAKAIFLRSSSLISDADCGSIGTLKLGLPSIILVGSLPSYAGLATRSQMRCSSLIVTIFCSLTLSVIDFGRSVNLSRASKSFRSSLYVSVNSSNNTLGRTSFPSLSAKARCNTIFFCAPLSAE